MPDPSSFSLGALSANHPYLTALGTGLAATALGGGAARLATSRRPDESDEDYNARVRTNTMTGVLGGAAVGLSVPSLVNAVNSLAGTNKSVASKIWDKVVNPDNAITGVSAGAGALTGGRMGDKAVKALQEQHKLDLDTAHKTWQTSSKAKLPSATADEAAYRALVAKPPATAGIKRTKMVGGGLIGGGLSLLAQYFGSRALE